MKMTAALLMIATAGLFAEYSARAFVSPPPPTPPADPGSAQPAMIQGLDADTILTPYVSVMKAEGIKFAMRYLKNLSRSEVNALHGAGIQVVAIFELSELRSLLGTSAGREDGERALAQMEKLGAPSTAAIYATVDYDMTSSVQVADITKYFTAFEQAISGHYQIGGYADGLVLNTLDRDHLTFAWLPATDWDDSREFLSEGHPTLVQGLPGKRLWEGLSWPELDGLHYDPDVAMAPVFGAF